MLRGPGAGDHIDQRGGGAPCRSGFVARFEEQLWRPAEKPPDRDKRCKLRKRGMTLGIIRGGLDSQRSASRRWPKDTHNMLDQSAAGASDTTDVSRNNRRGER